MQGFWLLKRAAFLPSPCCTLVLLSKELRFMEVRGVFPLQVRNARFPNEKGPVCFLHPLKLREIKTPLVSPFQL